MAELVFQGVIIYMVVGFLTAVAWCTLQHQRGDCPHTLTWWHAAALWPFLWYTWAGGRTCWWK